MRSLFDLGKKGGTVLESPVDFEVGDRWLWEEVGFSGGLWTRVSSRVTGI